MNESAQKSFEIRTCRDFLDELLRPAVDDFLQDRHSSRKAIVCVLFGWHLHDWVWAQHKRTLMPTLGMTTLEEFETYLVNRWPDLQLVREIANGSKHFRGDGSRVQGTALSHGHW